MINHKNILTTSLMAGAFVVLCNSRAMAANIESNSTIDFNSNSEYGNLITPVVQNYEDKLIITEKPEEGSAPVGMLPVGSAVEVVRRDDIWTQVRSGDLTGWVKTSETVSGYDMEAYIIDNSEVFNREGTVLQDGVEVSDPNGTGEVLGILRENDKVHIIQQNEDYFYVRADSGFEGYIKKDTLQENPVQFKSADKIEKPSVRTLVPDNSIIQAVNPNYGDYQMIEEDPNKSNGYTSDSETELRKGMVNYGLQFLGNKYVFGGTSMTNGVDCSAFVQNIYRNYGYMLPRTAAEQARVGTEIAQTDMRPGDLLFYWDTGRNKIGHVTMYIGNNKVLHASNSTDGIIISNASYRRPSTIRRIVND